jgi:hypothetical protein
MPPFCGNNTLQQVLNQINAKLTALSAASVDLSPVMTNISNLDLSISNYNLERQMQLSAAEAVLLTAIEAIDCSGGGSGTMVVTTTDTIWQADWSTITIPPNSTITISNGIDQPWDVTGLSMKDNGLSWLPDPFTITLVITTIVSNDETIVHTYTHVVQRS